MKKNITKKIFGVLLSFSILGGLICAMPAANAAVTASDYLSSYYVIAQAGTNGRVVIGFDVNATGIMDLVGAYYLVVQVYNNGTWIGVASYFGSTSNGLLEANTSTHGGSITYTGTSGKLYRGLVTVYACDAYGDDYRTVATNSVTAQ